MTIDVESVESVVVDAGAVFCARHFEIGKFFRMRKDDDGVYDLETESEETDEDSSCREGGTRVNAAVPRDGKRHQRRDDEEAGRTRTLTRKLDYLSLYFVDLSMEKEERENSLSFCNSEKFLSNGSNRSILGTLTDERKGGGGVCVCVYKYWTR